MFCGVDEAGRGSVMGPLVVGAVYVEDDTELMELGVRDSKKLTPKRREAMFDRILDIADAYSVVTISADDIDLRRERESLNEIELAMFVDATNRYPVLRVYADCPDVNEMSFQSALTARLGGTEVIARHKADDTYPVVSAASIIAKVTRDRLIEDISKEFGESIGSGYPSDKVTTGFIEKWIKENGRSPPYTRNSWETVRAIKSRLSVRKLTDW
ncbi:MAG: ribonuclease HII [Candidatus Methanomethylophilaceae archaeon]|jgi:ribonuclease HII|nr:ribonuclease HII [Candidatus Methanomethylophilaceae archaeon]